MTGRARGERAGLTRAIVLSAGRELVAERGLQGLTMRALAERLEVSPNALYSHIPGKLALVDSLIDELLGNVYPSAAGADDPIKGLQDLMASTYELLLGYPELVPLYLTRQGSRGPHAQRLGEVVLLLLGRLELGGLAAREALRVLVVYTIGFAAFTTQPAIDQSPAAIATDDLRANFNHGLHWLLLGITGGSDRRTRVGSSRPPYQPDGDRSAEVPRNPSIRRKIPH